MLVLSTNRIRINDPHEVFGQHVFRLSTEYLRPRPLRQDEVFLWRDGEMPEGFRAVAFFSKNPPSLKGGVATIALPDDLDYLNSGDIIRIDSRLNALRVLYRKRSLHNTFLVTERCNHLCLMCSQPPKEIDDSWLIEEMLQTIPLIDPDTRELGFTGGEPTLLGDEFLKVLLIAKNYLPRTGLHILTNGRRFVDLEFAKKYADIAFDETIRGILNLKRLRQNVEIRVVVHKQNYERLPQLSEFIARNLTFVDHVALMGLEITGFTRANLADLWVDPFNYKEELRRAVTTLADFRMNVSVYNHQLCVIDRSIWPFARRSISDWKNEYMPECNGCSVAGNCGGFFSSAKHRYSDYIAPLPQ